MTSKLFTTAVLALLASLLGNVLLTRAYLVRPEQSCFQQQAGLLLSKGAINAAMTSRIDSPNRAQ